MPVLTDKLTKVRLVEMGSNADMDAANYRRIVDLVDAALELGPSKRTEFLDRECEGKPELRSEVESLLAEDMGEEDYFLSMPAAAEMAHLAADPGAEEGVDAGPPESVGSYRVLRELGRGGMGTVYLAEQREPIERRVALKVIHAFEGERGTRRFASECRALARLKHPNIAAVYDAGVTEDHRAYVAMEWVEGAHITEWCDQNELSLSARVELFLGVCAGVSHAHQKGLVHRDLKPSNVLVVDVDGSATAKVIDFGIARSLDESVPSSSVRVLIPSEDESSERGLQLSRSLLMGSPIYMSPEAADLHERSDVDTRTDVFSLGILLYEILLGVPPFELEGRGISGLLRQVRTVDSPRLSRRWAGLEADHQEELAELRGTDPGTLVGGLRGDLDAILAKATARERDRRYGSVAELAGDLRRHLERRPVEAREPTLRYQLSRFIRRHLGAVAAAAMLIGVLIAGVAARTLEARRANMEADRARLALAEAEQLSDFLIGLFEVVDPDRRAEDPESVDELLAKAEATVDEELADHPLARARLLQTFGRVAMNRRDLDRAADFYEQALVLREQFQASDHPELVRCVGSLGVIYRRQGRLEEAEAALVRATQLIESSEEPDTGHHSATLTWLANLHYSQSRLEEAVAGHRRALEIRRQEIPPNEGAIGESLNNLSVALRDMGRFVEAKPLLHEAETYFTRALGPEHPVTIGCKLNLAGIEEKLGNWHEAESLLRETASAWEEIHGPLHYRTLLARRAIGSLWFRWWRVDEAAAHLADLLREQEAESAEAKRDIARTQFDLAKVLRRRGDLDEAERIFLQSLEVYKEVLGEDHYLTGSVEAHIALVDWKRGELEKAVETLQSLATKWEENLGERHSGVGWAFQSLAEIWLEQGRLEVAEIAFTRALNLHEDLAGENPSVKVGENLLGLGQLRLEQGRDEEASELLGRSLEILEKLLPPEHPDLVTVRAELAAL